MRKIFYVDQALCGGEELPADFELEEFCEVLQGKVPELEIVPVTGLKESAVNRDPSLVTETVLNEALGEYAHR